MNQDIKGHVNFLGIEKENELKNIVNLGGDIFLIHNLDQLYITMLGIESHKKEFKRPFFLFLNIHREFYLCVANFLRMHRSKAFVDLRLAIDSALTAYYLIQYPEKEEIYLSGITNDMEKQKKCEKIFNSIKKTIKKEKAKFPCAIKLVGLHEYCSIYAHADAIALLSRYIDNEQGLFVGCKYFDYENKENDNKRWLGVLLEGYYEIFKLFWNELFEKIASDRIKIKINERGKQFDNILFKFRSKYPIKSET